ncbi:hypothetical protein [Micromonospora sp. SL4-19]|uniref:hypothetical protein n=1 Tax=Micromonospora sp. SL4-19 TaxID=3399129 RepID=UPI003A4D31B3
MAEFVHVTVVRELDDPRGHEVFVPRAILSAEVWRIRDVPQGVGWRYRPAAHGQRPCPCPVCLPRGVRDTLGGGQRAGSNYTGQPAVNSYYIETHRPSMAANHMLTGAQ